MAACFCSQVIKTMQLRVGAPFLHLKSQRGKKGPHDRGESSVNYILRIFYILQKWDIQEPKL